MSKKMKLSKKTVKEFNKLAQILTKRVQVSKPDETTEALKQLDWFFSSLKAVKLR